MAHDIAKVPRPKANDDLLQQMALLPASSPALGNKLPSKIPSQNQILSLYTYAIEIAEETDNVRQILILLIF